MVIGSMKAHCKKTTYLNLSNKPSQLQRICNPVQLKKKSNDIIKKIKLTARLS